jgi:hypothetical protein
VTQVQVKKKSKKLLRSGWHTVTLDSISDSHRTDNDVKYIAIKFSNEHGFITLWLPLHPSSYSILCKMAYIAGYKDEIALPQLIDNQFNILIKTNKVIKIKKP